MEKQEKIILHIDFDSFFASCEQQFNPLLRNTPVGVTATNGRTCIIAASREAKHCGVKSPSRIQDAVEICPSIVFVPSHFREYFSISKKFLKICTYFSPTVEMFSIDEVFLDATLTAPLFGGVKKMIEMIKAKIKTEIGEYITASCGVSHSKMLAKLASGLKKPNGVCEIRKDTLERVYESTKLTNICGIGQRISLRLNKIGVYTLLQLRSIPLSLLIAEFGTVEGTFLKQVGLGIDDSPVVSYLTPPTVKSVGRNYCLPHNEYDQRIVLQNVYELSEEVGIKLRRLNKRARTVGLSLRGLRSEYGRKTLPAPIHGGADIFYACKCLYDEWKWGAHKGAPEVMVRQMSVWTSSLEEDTYTPLSFLENNLKTDRLIRAVDKLNDKYGDHTIRNGFLLYADKLTTMPNGYGADRYDRIKLAEEQPEYV